ncbi:lambda exonuclease family protein [Zavarzinella formosa]|uniref:lambda exonuclease family protein n=1 Tax=Zavarzinella formosa TaxID=360055 RepID=UPI00031BE215|nr:YqaJ viral recombinase family protein [Zavarzinella formosa]
MIRYHRDLTQGSPEWHAIRCGLLTASEMKNIITPSTLKYANNEKSRSHMHELAAQRINKFVEQAFVNDDMQRGKDDEFYARQAYSEHYEPVEEVGFVTNDEFGFTLGYSPDGLVGKDGAIEVKSRKQKYQLETTLSGIVPEEYMIQIQTGLLVTRRKWCDFISFCGGTYMIVIRVPAKEEMQRAIITAAKAFHVQLGMLMDKYQGWKEDQQTVLIPTERRATEIFV